MKPLNSLVVICCAAFLANSAHADRVSLYQVDSTQSYVQAYVPRWKAFVEATGSMAPDAPLPPSEIVWLMDWHLEKNPLSGDFEGTSELSPWRPDAAHLTLANVHLHSQLPGFMPSSVLSSQISYLNSTGALIDPGPCGMNDPFIPPGTSISCWSTGFGTPYYSGSFNGETLDLMGGSGALPPFGIIFGTTLLTPIDYSGPVPFLDTQQYPTQWDSYRIVANLVPEPGTLPLVLTGALIYLRRGSKHQKSHAADSDNGSIA